MSVTAPPRDLNAGFLGAVLDVDSHELAPAPIWGEVFGEVAARIAEVAKVSLSQAQEFAAEGITVDDREITGESVWNVRGPRAPGAFDMTRRLEVMDAMGIRRALLFPTYAIFPGLFVTQTGADLKRMRLQDGMTEAEIRELGRAGLREYNEWAVKSTKIDRDRLRCVGYLDPTTSVEELIEYATHLIRSGIRALNLPVGTPPAGTSPANPALDPLWAAMEDADVPLVCHLGGQHGFLAAGQQWSDAPVFERGKINSVEISLDAFHTTNMHLPIDAYLTTLVLGGVLERFPRLRVGVIELGAGWLGPLARRLDVWGWKVFRKRLDGPFLSMPPSDYIRRNVRATPFNGVESAATMLTDYPDLQDCYCFSTDYPHVEGRVESKQMYYDDVAPLGEEMLRKFFVDNGKLLLPD